MLCVCVSVCVCVCLIFVFGSCCNQDMPFCELACRKMFAVEALKHGLCLLYFMVVSQHHLECL